jgi:flagella basal body P-ring formation protein FlgA
MTRQLAALSVSARANCSKNFAAPCQAQGLLERQDKEILYCYREQKMLRAVSQIRAEIPAFPMGRPFQCQQSNKHGSNKIRSAASVLVNFLTPAKALLAVIILLTGYAISSPLTALANEAQSLDSIRQVARNFVLNTAKLPGITTEAEVGSLDSRLRLALCPAPLTAFLPAGAKLSGNATVGVRCQDSKPWTVYVPVRIKLNGQVLVVTRPMAKGALIKEADVRLETRDMAALPVAPLTESSQAVGKLAKRALGIGTVISVNELQVPRLVRRGDRITILAAESGIEIRANGEALMDGAEGDRIRVRNSLTDKVIQATVVSAGLVQVNL